MMKAIDLYSGIGGWTLGFKMAGIEIVSSYEWWKDANLTHNKNFGTDQSERNIRELDLKNDLPDPNEVDFVLGSPPCTQFSYANRGGKGDIADGLIDIYKFLEVVEYISPKYWAMENVPRVAGILKKAIQPGGDLERFAHLFDGEYGVIDIYNSADFGVPQSRKRMIAGRFPHQLFESYIAILPKKNLKEVIDNLKGEKIIDPNYGHTVQNLTDHIIEAPLTEEETRINRDSKSYHPVYNKMSFPDDLYRASRTVTALCTRVSRESIIIEDPKDVFRRLTIRERGCIQSFPADYQFYSNSYGGKIKMIGNAVPPLLTYYIAKSMLETPIDKLEDPKSLGKIKDNKDDLPKFLEPDTHGSKFPWSRSFWLAIPNLRFGSGVRFELRNTSNKEIEKTFWWINFFYGNSKKIKQRPLDRQIFQVVWESLTFLEIANLEEVLIRFKELINSVDVEGLQDNWNNKDRTRNSPIWLVDRIGDFASEIINTFSGIGDFEKRKLEELVEMILKNGNGQVDNKKLIDNSDIVLTGILLGSIFNTLMTGEKVDLSIGVDI